MFRISMLPLREAGTMTLMATNEDWQELQKHLKAKRQGRLLTLIVLDMSEPVTILTLPTEQAQALLHAANLRY